MYLEHLQSRTGNSHSRKQGNPQLRPEDKLKHSEIIMDDIANLRYNYGQIHAAITHRYVPDKDKLSFLIIGGGGYVYSRYLEKFWPGSQVDVAEIDPGVTEAAMAAFGLDRDTSIRTINMDARNYVDQLLNQEDTGGDKTRYDFIYEDAVNDYSVPFQLVTKEFNDKIARLLTDDGIYLIVLIEIYDSGKLIGSYINTLEQTFPHVYVVTKPDLPSSSRNTFVIAASKRPLNLDNLAEDYKQEKLELWNLNEAEIAQLKENAGNIIITDDYAPVENMLAPVVRQSATDFLALEYLEQAKEFLKQGKLEESFQKYQDLAETDPTEGTMAYNEMGLILVRQQRIPEAIEMFKKAIDAAIDTTADKSIASVHFSLGIIFKKMDQPEQAALHLGGAIEGFRREVEKNPDSQKTFSRLGDALAENGDFEGASKAFADALALEPLDNEARMNLVATLEFQSRIDEAVVVLKDGIELMKQHNQADAATQISAYLQRLQNRQ